MSLTDENQKARKKTSQLHISSELHLLYKSYCARAGKTLQEVTEKLINDLINASVYE
ncbi:MULTISPECIES: hypothetical protein [Cysteiniphilum]|uniref:Uncharacterized protein n=1 Tax=Cysteiniphilum litorale TaxID=2056700 RepID=A0A8J2Z2X0_9GAMM|nr:MULTISPECIES: hypothetical protein [Cysteiniphilum]GGF92757.1 hypothetical protein GCM10010995_07390 [Cysteiniphilum litorale]